MLTIILSLLALISGAINIHALYYGPQRNIFIFKPLTMVFIILIAILDPMPVSSFYQKMVVIGLLFSLAGDIFLMLPSDKFIHGLVSFLIAHIFYIVAFSIFPHIISFSSSDRLLYMILLALPFLIYGGILLRALFPHLGPMKLPVIIYAGVLLIMGWQALSRWLLTDMPGGMLAALGAIIFISSDSTLALNRFRGKFRSADFIIMSTYFTAQWLIAMSI